MNNVKRALALLLCLVMVLSYVPAHGHAANSATNVSMAVDKTQVEVGDTVTVTLSHTTMTVASFTAGISFDKDLFECVTVEGPMASMGEAYASYFYLTNANALPMFAMVMATAVSTPAEANTNGNVGFAVAGTADVTYTGQLIYTVTFKAKANGEAVFALYEDSSGTDGYKNDSITTTTVTIGGSSEPECEHTSTKLVPNNNGTHNVVCAAEGCGHVVTENVTCTGTDDGDHTTDVTCACGYVVTAGTEHVDTTPKDHVCDYDGCDFAMGTHADGDDANHTCDYCGGAVEGETHTEGEPVKNTEESTDATCTEGGTLVEDIFCTECGELVRTIRTTLDPTCTTGTVDYTWGTNNVTCKATLTCEHGTVLKEEKVDTTNAVTTTGDCQTAEVVTYYADFADFEDVSIPVTGEKDMTKHTGTKTTSYTNNGANHTETVTCSCGGTVSTETVAHDFNNDAHTCACGAVEMFNLWVYDLNGTRLVNTQVAYGSKIYDYVKELVSDPRSVNTDDQIGYNVFTGWVDQEMNPIDEEYTMPAGDLHVIANCAFTGWIKYGYLDGWVYEVKNQIQKTGWTEIDGAWYYLDPATGIRAEGLTRVPYPETAINGKTYAPDAEALAYCESKGETFVDATKAWFYFDNDGKFAFNSNGYVGHEGSDAKLVNGMLAWHPGMVELAEGEYAYFIGDTVNGGNKMATGDVYVQRNTTDRDFVIGGIYTFDADGMLCEYNGITDMANGTKRYYEDAQLMAGNGLTKVGDKFIYVRSNGELVVSSEFYVPANGLGVVAGTYTFDASGYLVNPELTSKNGVIDGYYYVDGKIAYGAGLIETDDGVIYVKSNGQLATGEYYVTNLTNYTGTAVKYGDKVTFDADGYMVAAKNGIVDGYYYVNNTIAYGAGLVETADGYIYVRSNGQVVKGTSYWITKVNDTGVVAKLYTFDDNGIMLNPEFAADAKNGIVDGYYYENGNIVYGAGLIEYNGGIIYVRSNGQVATGKYWVTNTNGLKEAGYYTFGEDGMMIN